MTVRFKRFCVIFSQHDADFQLVVCTLPLLISRWKIYNKSILFGKWYLKTIIIAVGRTKLFIDVFCFDWCEQGCIQENLSSRIRWMWEIGRLLSTLSYVCQMIQMLLLKLSSLQLKK